MARTYVDLAEEAYGGSGRWKRSTLGDDDRGGRGGCMGPSSPGAAWREEFGRKNQAAVSWPGETKRRSTKNGNDVHGTG